MKQSADMETKLQQLKPVLSNEFNASKIGYFGIMLGTCKIWPAHLPEITKTYYP